MEAAFNNPITAPAFFSKIPAFGFETKSLRATEKAAEFAEKLYNKKNNSSNHYVKKGFDKVVDKRGGPEAYKNSLAQKTYKGSNVAKVLGYIPGIGTLIGLGRIYKVATNREIYSKKEYLRAAIESLSLGIFLIPADIAVTCYRNKKWKKMQTTQDF